MKITWSLFFSWILLIPFTNGQNQLTSPPSKTQAAVEVPFISVNPKIDGILDQNLESIPTYSFNYIWQFDNPVTDTATVNYRLAYTPTHLYLYIETNVDSISYHRRGYLWGDGYKILVGMPQKDSSTNEYYELSFSPTLDPSYAWDRQRIMAYNFDQATPKLSDHTHSQEKAQAGKSGFEALIAWSDIPPYHPWFLKAMGFNLYFAKGIESKEHGYFTNGYAVVADEGIWDEELPKRNFHPLSFEAPKKAPSPIVLVEPNRRHLYPGEPISLTSIAMGTSEETPFQLSLVNAAGKIIFSEFISIPPSPKKTKRIHTLNMSGLPIGEYDLMIKVGEQVNRKNITLQPNIDFTGIETNILQRQNTVKKGALHTLLFKLHLLKTSLADLKSYEPGVQILEAWDTFQQEYGQLLNGKDPYHGLVGPYRRAFQSKYDQSYQPYSLKLPQDYDPGKKYPLLVFLHGSGQDEQSLLNKPRSNGQFIELAPLARDKYRAYAEDYSQKDIIEAIEDVKAHFSVDDQNIIIGGFSMGGYGALRTFYEHPALYKAIAVFAGHPNLANEWLDGDHPNFFESDYLTPFKGKPIFIFHGEIDPALGVKAIQKMADTMESHGVLVTKSIVPNHGHQYQDEATNTLYFKWLEEVINSK